MSEAQQDLQPPQLLPGKEGGIEPNSLADLIEWFLNYDERTSRIRHPHSEELFQWKQQDDEANGIGIYPFENAESRFAIGVFQALEENRSEPMLDLWMNDLMSALHESRTTKQEITEAYKLDEKIDDSALLKSEKLTTGVEKRFYLTSCWLETLFTAEARVLGWVFQSLYGKPFAPKQ